MGKTIEDRLRRLEDQLAIYQVVNGYSYGVDGLNAAAVGTCYTDDGVYAVGDLGAFDGRERIEAIVHDPAHIALVETGCAHMSSIPHVCIDGDCAVATCYTTLLTNGPAGYRISRLSASRMELVRQPDGGWKIAHRQNHLLDGSPEGPALLSRAGEGPAGPSR